MVFLLTTGVRYPIIKGDRNTAGFPGKSVTVDLRNARSLKVQKPDKIKAILLVGGMVIGILAIAAFIVSYGGQGSR